MTPQPPSIWADAALAAALLAVDPAGLGGAVIRGRPGPVRDAWLVRLRELLPDDAPWGRIPAHIQDDRLLGGLDLPASLAARRPIQQLGVLARSHGGVAVLAMAERVEDGVGARLARVLDTGEIVLERDGLATRTPARLGLVALDEGAASDERLPDALADRLAFHLELDALSVRDLDGLGFAQNDIAQSDIAKARERLQAVAQAPCETIDALCRAALELGLLSIRAPLLAVRAASAHAALQGRSKMIAEDAVVAARLVLAPHGASPETQGVDSSPPEQSPPETSSDTPSGESREPSDNGRDTDQLIAAVRAVLPEHLADRVQRKPRRITRTVGGRGSGAAAPSFLRGRPSGARAGVPRSGQRLDLTETLRAAAPWQKLRGSTNGAGVRILTQDLRIRRFVQRREGTTIFVVDASGSAAFQRLAEAKGAVELLLARAYVARTRVALVAFRKTRAEVLLAPTRSLTRAKRELADVMGGGGTPLAAGIEAGLELALAEQAKARTPTLIMLTDGRANIARDGSPGRAQADSDALVSAQRVREAGVGGVFIDTSPRPRPEGDRYARAMGAVYHPLPYCDASAVSDLIDGLRRPAR